jgi:hypothetical protein
LPCYKKKKPEIGKFMNKRNLCLTVLDPGKSKIKVQVGLVPGKGCSVLSRWCLIVTSMVGGGRAKMANDIGCLFL